jgi:maltose O-acetyltransferase
MKQPHFLTDLRQEVKTLRRQVTGFRDRIRGKVDMEALVAKGLTVQGHVYLANWVLIDQVATYLITIGDGTVVSPRVQILAHDAAAKRATGYTRLAPVTIGQHVYIGTDSLIMPGVTIGDGAIIGAGSLVTSDIPAGAIAVGRPARVVGSAADFEAKRRAQLEEGPVFTLDDVTTPEGRSSVRKSVQEAGHGFIP